MQNKDNRSSNEGFFGLPPVIFAITGLIVLVAVFLGVLPAGMTGVLAFLILTGTIFAKIGDQTPIIKDFLGGAPLICIFGAAALVYFGILSVDVTESTIAFMKQNGFLSFYIASLITGSILGMDSQVLIKAGVRYIVPLLGGVVATLLIVGLAGLFIGYGFRQTVLFIFFPIIGGGMGAGAVPMSEIVSDISGKIDPTTALSMFVPALALGNVFAIIAAGLLNRLGEIRPSTTGNGTLLKGFAIPKVDKPTLTVRALGTGLFLSCVFFTLGKVWEVILPAVHSYALMILSVAVVKIFNLLPAKAQNDCDDWYRFVVKNFTPALLVGIGIAYTDLGAVFAALSFQFIFLVFTTIVTVVIVTGFLGRLVGFYFVESALTSGLGMADMGGTGDVAVLSAAKRMELMPFMQISSRLGGALVLVLVGILAPLLL